MHTTQCSCHARPLMRKKWVVIQPADPSDKIYCVLYSSNVFRTACFLGQDGKKASLSGGFFSKFWVLHYIYTTITNCIPLKNLTLFKLLCFEWGHPDKIACFGFSAFALKWENSGMPRSSSIFNLNTISSLRTWIGLLAVARFVSIRTARRKDNAVLHDQYTDEVGGSIAHGGYELWPHTRSPHRKYYSYFELIKWMHDSFRHPLGAWFNRFQQPL